MVVVSLRGSITLTKEEDLNISTTTAAVVDIHSSYFWEKKALKLCKTSADRHQEAPKTNMRTLK